MMYVCVCVCENDSSTKINSKLVQVSKWWGLRDAGVWGETMKNTV